MADIWLPLVVQTLCFFSCILGAEQSATGQWMASLRHSDSAAAWRLWQLSVEVTASRPCWWAGLWHNEYVHVSVWMRQTGEGREAYTSESDRLVWNKLTVDALSNPYSFEDAPQGRAVRNDKTASQNAHIIAASSPTTLCRGLMTSCVQTKKTWAKSTNHATAAWSHK